MSVYTVSSETDIGTGAAANDALWIYDTSAGAMRKVTAGRVSGAPVNCTASTLAVDPATHAGKVVTLNRAGGIAVTLPVASGTGDKYTFIIGTTFTSSATIKVTGDDTMTGNALLAQDAADTAVLFEAGATADTITFDGSTTGGLKGTIVELIDIAADLWFVRLNGAATGTEATPFSATV
jgi:redox-sensitive bicupin YhaK (pirin superfamily)